MAVLFRISKVNCPSEPTSPGVRRVTSSTYFSEEGVTLESDLQQNQSKTDVINIIAAPILIKIYKFNSIMQTKNDEMLHVVI